MWGKRVDSRVSFPRVLPVRRFSSVSVQSSFPALVLESSPKRPSEILPELPLVSFRVLLSFWFWYALPPASRSVSELVPVSPRQWFLLWRLWALPASRRVLASVWRPSAKFLELMLLFSNFEKFVAWIPLSLPISEFFALSEWKLPVLGLPLLWSWLLQQPSSLLSA